MCVCVYVSLDKQHSDDYGESFQLKTFHNSIVPVTTTLKLTTPASFWLKLFPIYPPWLFLAWPSQVLSHNEIFLWKCG